MNLSHDDRRRLEMLRLTRLTALLPVFPKLVHLDLERCIHLHMADPSHSDLLLKDQAELREAAWLVMGCDRIVVWAAQEQVWDSEQIATVTAA